MASILKGNGSYMIMVSAGYDISGKQLRKTMHWKPDKEMTEKQIEKAVNEIAVTFEKQVLSGQVLDGTVTFAEFTERWCSDYAEVQLSPKTYERYKSMLKRILPAIGHIRLDKLQPHHLMELYKDMGGDINRRGLAFIASDEMLTKLKDYTRDYISQTTGLNINTIYKVYKGESIADQTAQKVCDLLGFSFDVGFRPAQEIKGLSNKTIKHHHRLISAILGQAVYWQVIPMNIATRVKPPKIARSEAKYLDEKQAAELIKLLENETILHQSLIKLFLLTGLRRGEMCGLEWDDIDFVNHMLTVRRSSQYVAGKGIFTKETKTETSDRTIKIPDQAFTILKELQMQQNIQRTKMGDRWETSDRIFTQEDGKPIHPDSITGWFREFIAKTDLPKISIHSLRHTNITLLIAAGVPLMTVSYRAGHSQTSTTSNIYSHAIKTADEMASEVLDNILVPMNVRSRIG